MVSAVSRTGVHGEVLPESRLQRKADCHAYQRQAVVLRGRTLFGGTQAEFQNRGSRLPSGKRPKRQVETCTCHQRATDWRMVQGAVRQAIFIHSENGYTAQKGQRLRVVSNANGRIVSLCFGMPKTACYLVTYNPILTKEDY